MALLRHNLTSSPRSPIPSIEALLPSSGNDRSSALAIHVQPVSIQAYRSVLKLSCQAKGQGTERRTVTSFNREN